MRWGPEERGGSPGSITGRVPKPKQVGRSGGTDVE